MATGDGTSSGEPMRPSFGTRDSMSAFEMEVQNAFETREYSVSPEPVGHFDHESTQTWSYTTIAEDQQDRSRKDGKTFHTTTHFKGRSSRGPRRLLQSRKRTPYSLGRAAAFWTDSWVAEVLSCVLAISALIGMTVTLSMFQGKPLAAYPWRISLNTMVSVFSAILKAALLMPVAEGISQLKWLWFVSLRPLLDFVDFDLASRGPWGSILLLLRLHSGHLASIGAWITIGALAIDPFSQQIIQNHLCSQNLPGAIALIPRVNNFTNAAGSKIPNANATANGTSLQAFANLNQDMSTAIYMGLLNPPQNASQNIPVLCSTGNCTFPFDKRDGATYQTLSFGTSCNDVSGTVKHVDSVQTIESDSSRGRYIDGYSMTGYEGGTMKVDFTDRDSIAVAVNATDSAGSASEAYLVHFSMLMMNIDWNKCSESGPGPNMLEDCTPRSEPLAIECTLFPKIQTFNATVVNGTLTEKLIAEEPVPHVNYDRLATSTDEMLYPWTRIANRTLQDGVWQSCTPSDTYSQNDSVIAFSDRLRIKGERAGTNRPLKYYPQSCVWAIDDLTTSALQQFLMTMFSDHDLELRWADNGISYRGDPWILNLYNNGTANTSSVRRYFRGLEDAMSASLRTFSDKAGSGGNSSIDYVDGEAYVMQTCIAVEWWWMAFPAALTLASALFLGATYWRTSKERTGVGSWKSFTLADLFTGLDEGIRGRYGEMAMKSEMQDAAEGIRVRLVRTEGGWRLKEDKLLEDDGDRDEGG